MATNAPAVTPPRSRQPRPFAASHPADAWFFPGLIAIIWLIMLIGFVPEVVQRMNSDAEPFPLVIHAHAVVYFGWLTFLASQVVLVRTGNIAWHRRMGTVGVAMAIAVIILGPAAALTQQLSHVARQPPQFLGLQFANVIVFGGFVIAALALRVQPAAHKRLMVVGTLALIGAGFGRVVRLVTGAPPPSTLIPGVYIAANVLLLAIAIHDYRTRGRLHPVFLPAAALFVGSELVVGLLLRSPAWIGFTRALVG
ncbi:MAG: hypothetical protein DCF31_11480 [Alphaproteobacteria bacterium]|nr:MAG: hypothetical protein DCF31_11480 [Alphaproteobacteria bacterium]